jgi:very-short-patch-repair endonuclease
VKHVTDRTSPAATPPAPEQRAPDQRRALVDQAIAAWQRRLIDRSRGNTLLYFRDLKSGTLDLSAAPPERLQQLLAGATLRIDQLVPEQPGLKPGARARAIMRRARVNQEEKGIATLFLALGLASWPTPGDRRPPAAPVLLVPMQLELLSRVGPVLTLARAGEAQLNHVLLDELERTHGCRIDPEQVLSEDAETPAQVQAVFARLRAAAALDGFDIAERSVLGNFAFLKLAIMRDLGANADLIAAHPVLAALAGAEDARAALRAAQAPPPDPRTLDQTPPEREFLALDADSSQQRVIGAVLRGQHGVIQGPPGTGKSQTIANLIIALAAEGRRVLFVAEKRAALEVVQRRLEQVGLGHLALDLHGADVARSAVVQRFAHNLALVREAPPVDAAAVHAPFADRRARLNRHVQALHAPRAPSGLSLYEIEGRLLRMPAEAQLPLRWRGAALQALDQPAVARLTDQLLELGGFADLLFDPGASPWTGAASQRGEQVQTLLAALGGLVHEHLPALRRGLQELAAATTLPLPQRLDAVPGLLALLGEVNGLLQLYQPTIFLADLDRLAHELADARAGMLVAGFKFLFSQSYRTAEQQAESLRRAPLHGPERGPTLAREVEQAAGLLRRWRALAPQTHPVPTPALPQVQAHHSACLAALETLRPWLDLGRPLSEPLDALAARLADLDADSRTLFRAARMNELVADLQRHGLAPLLEAFRRERTPAALWPQQLAYAWLASCLDQTLAQESELAGFSGPTHTRFAQEFRALDRERLAVAARRVRRAHAERVIAAMNAHPHQEELVRREAAKRKRHLPLRALLARAPEVLTILCPCWMASPLSVSQLMDARQTSFDVVIFDEASQVLPEEAVAALLRGRQVVVAGDRHQLPPTRFFISGDADEEQDEDAAPTEGFESLLDLLAAQLDTWSLDWHYRSRDEALIAFSNRHIYSGRLVTFPGPRPADVLTHVPVPWSPERDSSAESADAEVERVVGLILEHAEARPGETLGVIALGIKHAQRLEQALDQALAERPDLEPFFGSEGPEPFFIKNLERVQGDERDAIILSIGYGKDRHGRLPHRFGPLLLAGGERRLNVAVTRARRRLTLVTSFSHHDIDPARSAARGVDLLRRYVEYAAGGARSLSADGPREAALNPFEADVCDTLRASGLALIPQWGASGYRLDFAVQHPERPGQLVLALECDGASYHAAPTARDRDRLRQQHLEALGWRFHRIWSQDWFHRREAEVARAWTPTPRPCARRSRPPRRRRPRLSHPPRSRHRPTASHTPGGSGAPRSPLGARSLSTARASWCCWCAGSSPTGCCAPTTS